MTRRWRQMGRLEVEKEDEEKGREKKRGTK